MVDEILAHGNGSHSLHIFIRDLWWLEFPTFSLHPLHCTNEARALLSGFSKWAERANTSDLFPIKITDVLNLVLYMLHYYLGTGHIRVLLRLKVVLLLLGISVRHPWLPFRTVIAYLVVFILLLSSVLFLSFLLSQHFYIAGLQPHRFNLIFRHSLFGWTFASAVNQTHVRRPVFLSVWWCLSTCAGLAIISLYTCHVFFDIISVFTQFKRLQLIWACILSILLWNPF